MLPTRRHFGAARTLSVLTRRDTPRTPAGVGHDSRPFTSLRTAVLRRSCGMPHDRQHAVACHAASDEIECPTVIVGEFYRRRRHLGRSSPTTRLVLTANVWCCNCNVPWTPVAVSVIRHCQAR